MHADGRIAEAWVAARLAERGWRILARNLRTPYGELDLLCHAGAPVLAAVEVKARHPLAWLHDEEALRPRQRRRIARALRYAAQCRGWRGSLRVDLAAVDLVRGRPVGWRLLEHVHCLDGPDHG